MEFVQQTVAQIHDWDRSRQISPYILDCGQRLYSMKYRLEN